MKKVFLVAALVALFGLTPEMVSAQAPSPFTDTANFLQRQNYYDSMTMNREWANSSNPRYNRRRKSSRYKKRRHRVVRRRHRVVKRTHRVVNRSYRSTRR